MAEGTQDAAVNTQDGVVIDELLCFACNKIDTLPPQTIVELCVSTYTEGEIEAAKRRLFDICADDSTSRFRKRQGPKKSVQNVDDIVRLLQEKGTNLPSFVALDLSRLPPITFDSIDVSTLLNNIRRTQLEVDQLKACVNTQREATDGLTAVISTVDQRLAEVENTSDIPYDDGSRHGVPVPVVSDDSHDTHEGEDDRTLVKQPVGGHVITTPAEDSIDWPALVVQPNPTMNSATTSTTHSGLTVRLPPLNAGPREPSWTTVARRNRPEKRERAPATRQQTKGKPKGITGSAKGSGLKSTGQKRFASVFATRFEPHVTDTDIAHYLSRRLDVKVAVEAVDTKYDTYSSFHITCECADPAIFMEPSLWPEDIFVRWWRSPRNTTATSSRTRRPPQADGTHEL